MNTAKQDLMFMLEALQLSRQALPNCRPNPPVGCVLVVNQQIISAGFTQEPGAMHAEAQALAKLHKPLTNVTAYVTLEPCSFVGRTEACAQSLIDSKISRVVIAMLDPDPRNSGAGLAMLEAAGIAVKLGVGASQVQDFLGPYLCPATVN